MALIQCSQCRGQVSSEAQSCPHCGNPMHPVLIEQTDKKWKFTKLMGWVFFLFGIWLFLVSVQRGGFNNPYTSVGFCLGFIGFITLIAGKLGAWWNHK